MIETTEKQVSFELALTRLQQQLAAWNSDNRTRLDRTKPVIQLSCELEAIDLLLWLDAQPAGLKHYWRSRDNQLEQAGVGAAHIVAAEDRFDYSTLLKQMKTTDPSGSGGRYFGGFRFDAPACHPRAAQWEVFGATRLVLPRLEVVKDTGSCRLILNLLQEDLQPEARAKIARWLTTVNSPAQPVEETQALLLDRSDLPDRDEWRRCVLQALQSFDSGEIEKVVLARQSSINFAGKLNPWQLLRGLRKTTTRCFLFGFQVASGPTFIGASPERLYRRSRDQIETEAVAGTRPRGATVGADERLTNDLLSSDKEQREHQLVVHSIAGGLQQLCESYTIGRQAEPMKLTSVQHLVTNLRGCLKPGFADAELLATLHPSPAVGGYPSHTAQAGIEQLEPFDRGWYAGPIGWIGNDAAEFAVAIRSGLVAGSQLSLFSGAGIVRGSTPEAEWTEIENKMATFLRTAVGKSR